jgi:predicted transcriptional regulator of viral defense system
MRKKGKIDNTKRLFKIANSQLGLFTSKQAERAGFPRSNQVYHVKQGNWKRVQRGIYRLTNYPVSEFEQMMAWYLWSRGRPSGSGDEPQGVYSHETALSLHDLSDVNPARLYMTVPEHFRRSIAPSKVLVIHKSDLSIADVSDFHGMKITTPLKTLLDVIKAAELSSDLIRQAVMQASRRGLITMKDMEKHPALKRYWTKK